ncbi:MAG: GAF domain-containing protein [Deltaproteobacteria bacterium]|nr:GAF domain-containing protein [Deltaproteobacteria bacterium]
MTQRPGAPTGGDEDKPIASKDRSLPTAARIVCCYIVAAGLWIILSDWLLNLLALDPATHTRWSVYKGWAFVLVTALLLAIELHAELAAREKSLAAKARSEEQLRLLGDNLPDSYVYQCVKNAEGYPHFLYLSSGVERLHGVTAEAVLRDPGLLYRQVAPETMRTLLDMEIDSRQNLADFSFELPICRTDGQRRWLKLCSHPRRTGEGKILWDGVATDITPLKQTQEENRRNADRLTAMIEVLQYRSQSLQDFLDHALEKAIGLTRSKIGYIFTYDEGRRELILNTWSKGVMEECSVADYPTCYELDKTGLWGEAVRQAKPILINDFEAPNPFKKGVPKGHVPLRRFLTVPIFLNKRIIAVVGVANKATDYHKTDTIDLTLLMDTVIKSAEAIKNEKELRRIEWLFTRKPPLEAKLQLPFYGDLTAHNEKGVILNRVGHRMLTDIVSDFLDLLETSAAIHEKNGDYALGMFTSEWCHFLDAASYRLCQTDDNRQALASGKWLCHESCWTVNAKTAIERGEPFESPCAGGLRLYAVPIFVGGEVVGAINIGYGDPPRDALQLKELAQRFQVSFDDLQRGARAYETRPPFIIELAKKRLRVSARLIGEIIERKQAEEKLQISESLYHTLFDATPLGLSIQDCRDFSFIEVNQAFLNLHGFSAESVKGLKPPHFCTFFKAADEDQIRGYLEQVTRGEVVHAEIRDLNHRGEPIWMNKTIRKVTLHGAERIMTFAQDITEKRQMQDFMIHNEKVMSLGVLAAGMAHEINNPLGIISQGVQNVLRRTREPLPANLETAAACAVSFAGLTSYLEKRNVYRSLEAIREAVHRSAGIVTTMLEFARKPEASPSPHDLNRLIEKTVELAATDYDLKKKFDFRNIRIDTDFNLREPVPCVASELEQVFLNLLRNSAQNLTQAAREEPRIILRTRRDGGWAVVEVEDNGTGIPPEIRPKIFDPFFTTKEIGVGTGLGLSISFHIIVERHHGEIRVESETDAYTRFILRLPLTQKW